MIERSPLRREVQREILARLNDRRPPAGSRINETHLAADIGVSRTPLREAMLGLEAGGFLESDMGRGFRVPALSTARFCEIQALLARLAPFALRQLPVPPANRIMELSNLLGRARLQTSGPDSTQGDTVAALIFRWSALLVEACPNRCLVGEIKRLEALAQPVWREAMTQGFAPRDMLVSYDALYQLLRSGDLDQAARHWEKHIADYAAAAVAHLGQ